MDSLIHALNNVKYALPLTIFIGVVIGFQGFWKLCATSNPIPTSNKHMKKKKKKVGSSSANQQSVQDDEHDVQHGVPVQATLPSNQLPIKKSAAESATEPFHAAPARKSAKSAKNKPIQIPIPPKAPPPIMKQDKQPKVKKIKPKRENATDLPLELWWNIISFIPQTKFGRKTLSNLGMTCKYLYDVCKEPLLDTMDSSHFKSPQQLRNFIDGQLPLFIKHLRWNPFDFKHAKRTISLELERQFFEKSTRLQTLVLPFEWTVEDIQDGSQDSLLNLINRHPSLESWSCHHFPTYHVGKYPSACQKLVKSTILSKPTDHMRINLVNALSRQFPNLKQVTMIDWDYHSNLAHETWQIIAAWQLESLTLVRCDLKFLQDHIPNTDALAVHLNLSDKSFDGAHKSTVLSHVSNIAKRTIIIKIVPPLHKMHEAFINQLQNLSNS
jgi:hypothetical protein